MMHDFRYRMPKYRFKLFQVIENKTDDSSLRYTVCNSFDTFPILYRRTKIIIYKLV